LVKARPCRTELGTYLMSDCRRENGKHAHIYARTYIHLCTHTYEHTNIYIHTYTFIQTYMHTYVHCWFVFCGVVFRGMRIMEKSMVLTSNHM